MGTFVNSSMLGSDNEWLIYPHGVNFQLSEFEKRPGMWKAASSASFRAGQFVSLNSSNELVISAGNNIYGVALANRTQSIVAVAVDESVTFTSTGAAVTLAHANISDVVVFSQVQNGGTRYTVTTDYTLNTTNGIITHVGAAGITVNTAVYVSYSYALTTSMNNQNYGLNFHLNTDATFLADDRVAVAIRDCTLFTSEFAKTGRTYAMTGTGSNLYVNGSGILTNETGVGLQVGNVIQVPLGDSPWLGSELSLSRFLRT